MTTNFDFQSHPLVAIWETNARTGPLIADVVEFPSGYRLELTDKEAEQLIRDMAELRPPIFIFAGDDPLRRKNIYSLIQYAASCGLHPRTTLGPNSQVTRKTISELKKAGLSRLSLTLEAGTPEAHDRLCGITGSFAGTLNAMRWSNECGLPLEIRTNLRRRNLHELENIAAVLKSFKILSWSISFPVPQPRESLRDLPCSSEFEEAFSRLHQLAQELPFKVKTVDAPHYRRFVVQQRSRARTNGGGLPAPQTLDGGIPGILPVNESRASIFISSTGDIFPSHGLRVAAGNIRRQKVADVYRNSELFRSLRDTGNLKGKCRDCEFKEMCGGSRARAWAVNEDMFAEEPCCSYLPATARKTG